MPFVAEKCHDNPAGIVSGIVNLVSDILVISLPILEVVRLQMSVRKTTDVSAVFWHRLTVWTLPRILILYMLTAIQRLPRLRPAPLPLHLID
jgi:hypothetical protein